MRKDGNESYDMKRCTKCKETKPLGEFSKHKNSKDGHAWRCKTCSSAYSREYRKTAEGIYQLIKGRNTFRRKHPNQFLLPKPVEITKEEFVEWYNNEPKICDYCELTEAEAKKFITFCSGRFGRLTIDCKDNEAGYIKGNLVLACYKCNITKNDMLTYDEMKYVGKHFIKPKWEERRKMEV